VGYRSHWNVIESIIDSHTERHPLEIPILKTIGILNLLDADDLMPTREAVTWAVAGKSPKLQRAVGELLESLTEKGVLYFRGESRGYSLWPYTSVDLESRLQEAKNAIPNIPQISDLIVERLDSRPIVARSHYIRTGNLRYFEVIYCRPEELADKVKSHVTSADGFITVPLCESERDYMKLLRDCSSLPPRADTICLAAVPRPLNNLTQAALDAMQWQWIKENTPQLNEDKFAQREVELHYLEAENRLQSQIENYIGLNRISGNSSLTWFRVDGSESQKVRLSSGREILHLLSELCDSVYDKAPQIKNELVNRHILSSAAAAARMRLIEKMLLAQEKELLGLPIDRKPPEKSMYLSVLKKTNLHRESTECWAISTPKTKKQDPQNVSPVIKEIKRLLASRPDQRISISEIMETLRRPPFGLRDGLFPILLAVIAVEDEKEIAFYENGTFLREIGRDAFLRMTKAPEKFEVQLCRIEGVRSVLFKQLSEILELGDSQSLEVELLDVVRSLCKFAAQLPEYVRNTKNLNQKTCAVRDVILDAREPVRMVFHDLPKACGFKEFETGKKIPTKNAVEFVKALKVALDEMRYAYPLLHQRMSDALCKEFGCDDLVFSKARLQIARRAEKLLLQVTDNKLKSFAFRLFDENLPEPDWLNSVGSVLALRPPDKWKDEDEGKFHSELELLAAHFRRVESAAFSGVAGDHGLRVAITQADGSERQEVIRFTDDEQNELKDLEDSILKILKKNPRLGVAAASQAIWSQLRESNE